MVRFLLLSFFFVFQLVISQEFEARVSNRQVGLEESFKIEFIVNDSGRNFSPPPFHDFHILSGPSTSTSTSWINGAFSQESRYTYVLKPKKTGVFTILPATIQVKGKTIGAQPVTIEVKKGTVSKKPNTPYDIAARNIHLEVKSNKVRVYLGEPVVLTYLLYWDLDVGNLNANQITYNNFLTNDIELSNNVSIKKFKGKNYKSAIIKQVILTPQSVGWQSVEKLIVDLAVSVPSNNVDFFGRPVNQKIRYSVSSNDINIEVLPLPVKNKPVNFSGAVGDFTLSVKLDKNQINVHESATYDVVVDGVGNLNVLTNPEVEFDNDLEDFAPKNSDKINLTNKGYSGYKKDEYLVVPRKRGVYQFKPIEFTFFNTKTKRYVTLYSSEKELKVEGDKFNYTEDTEFVKNQEEIEFTKKDIKFIKTDYNQSFMVRVLSNNQVFYILFFVPFLLFLIAVLYKKGFFNNFLPKENIKNKIDKKIRFAYALLADKKHQECTLVLLEVLFLYVSRKFLIDQADLSTQRIQDAFEKHEVNQKLVAEYLVLIRALELYRYSSLDDLNNSLTNSFIDRLSLVINKIEKEL